MYPGSGYLLFILVPQCFMLLPLRAAVVGAIGLTVVSGVSELAYDGTSTGSVITVGLFGLLTLAMSVLLGVYIAKIAEQSIQRASLIEELDATRTELARVSHDAGVMAERERLAGEIHDTLAQGFTRILMLVQAAQSSRDREAVRHQLNLAESTARAGLAEARSLITALGPVPLQSAPLAEAVHRVIREFGARTGVASHLDVVGEPRVLPADHRR